MPFPDLLQPCAVMAPERVRNNIRRMAHKAEGLRLGFRPHFKTHQSASIGEMFRGYTPAITVSNPMMGLYFAGYGWGRITLAFPVHPRQGGELRKLARAADTDFLVSSPEGVGHLHQVLEGVPGGVWIKVDSGYHRAGIPWDDAVALRRTRDAVEAAEGLSFRGILTHAGNAYTAGIREGVRRVHEASLERMVRGKNLLGGSCRISVGDTPSCSLAEAFPEVDEIRPGNFVFFDATQIELGSCSPEDAALAVLCPVVEIHRDRTVILGGAVHLSRDACPSGCFGYAAVPAADGFWNASLEHPLTGLSQEHGVVRGVPPGAVPGTLLPVVPAHACLAAALYSHYTDGEGNRFSRIPPA